MSRDWFTPIQVEYRFPPASGWFVTDSPPFRWNIGFHPHRGQRPDLFTLSLYFARSIFVKSQSRDGIIIMVSADAHLFHCNHFPLLKCISHLASFKRDNYFVTYQSYYLLNMKYKNNKLNFRGNYFVGQTSATSPPVFLQTYRMRWILYYLL